MTGGFTADDAAALLKSLQYVSITNADTAEVDIPGLQRLFEPQIAHHCANNRSLQLTDLMSGRGKDKQKLVPIDEFAILVNHDKAIAVPIEGYANLGMQCRYGELQQTWLR